MWQSFLRFRFLSIRLDRIEHTGGKESGDLNRLQKRRKMMKSGNQQGNWVVTESWSRLRERRGWEESW